MDRRSDRIIRWLLPTLGGLLFVAAYAFTVFLRGASLFAGDGDPGRHIRIGRFILEHRAIPRVDQFSHTMQGQAFVPFEWLSEVFFAAAEAWGGLAGVVLLTGALFAATVGLVHVAIRRAGVPGPIAFGFGFLALCLQAIHLHPRPHMFTTLLVAVFSFVLLEVRRDGSRWRLFALPLLMVAWVNLHGGFLVGFILLAAFTAEASLAWWRNRQSSETRAAAVWLIGTLVACFAVSLLNPAGWDLWPHTTGYLGETYLVDFTQEYKSPDFHDTLIKSFLLTLLFGFAVLALLRSRVSALGLALWVLFTAFALHSARNIPLFAVVCVPWLAVWTDALLAAQGGEPSGVPTRLLRWSRGVGRVEALLPGWPIALLAFALLTQGGLVQGERGAYSFSRDVFPVTAVEELKRSGFVPPGPVYNEFIWGGYLLYAWPEVPVFIDGQTDFYGEELTREYRDIRFIQRGWQRLLEERRVRWVLVPPDAPLAGALDLLDTWTSVYRDETAVVFVTHPGG